MKIRNKISPKSLNIRLDSSTKSYNILSPSVKIIQSLLWDLSIGNTAQSSRRYAYYMTSLENELPGKKTTSETQSPYLSILGL